MLLALLIEESKEESFQLTERDLREQSKVEESKVQTEAAIVLESESEFEDSSDEND